MRMFVILANAVLGLILIADGAKSQLYVFRVIKIQAIHIPSALQIILGVILILSVLAFKKDGRWAKFTLPTLTLLLSLRIAYIAYSMPRIVFAFLLFAFSISEIVYFALRKGKGEIVMSAYPPEPPSLP